MIPKKVKKVEDFSKPIIGKDLDFLANEAYKKLRTNLDFTFDHKKKCHVFGITSSISGEGKSSTSVNLAISFAEMGKRTLLIECDLRKPNLERYFGIKSSEGLANVLAGFEIKQGIIQSIKEYKNLYLITAGIIPPNPSELLSSVVMEEMIEDLSKEFDYIILDLPPVTAVADAMIVSRVTEGLLIVVREDYVIKSDLSETVRQLNMSNIKILGIAYNAEKDDKSGYYKKYKKYSNYKNYYQN
ncbi:MAG: CpsD/CapB family tyrosine-protein kinase [Clostridia bacterium]